MDDLKNEKVEKRTVLNSIEKLKHLTSDVEQVSDASYSLLNKLKYPYPKEQESKTDLNDMGTGKDEYKQPDIIDIIDNIHDTIKAFTNDAYKNIKETMDMIS